MNYITKKDIKLPKRKKSSKKGDNGKVLVIGGSKYFIGAISLAGLAALRSGVDWVTIAAPEKVAWCVNSLSPDIVSVKLKGNFISSKHTKIIEKLAKKHNVVLIGNGMGLNKETIKFNKQIIKKIKNLKVIDADGIKALSTADLENSIITPHIKELEIFMKNSKINNKIINDIIKEKNTWKQVSGTNYSGIERKALMIRKAIKLLSIKNTNNKNFFENDNIILLKGRIDAIISKDNILFNKTGNAGMSKAGTGDVLAGLCAGFLGQGLSLLQSAINAAYYNGLIGDILLKKKKGFTYLASDMVEEIKRVLKV